MNPADSLVIKDAVSVALKPNYVKPPAAFTSRIVAVVCAMAVQEGFFKQGSIPFKNYNPGDLTKWGKHPLFGRFVKFNSIIEGFEALGEDIQANKGHTLRSFINKFAPPTENNSSNYLAFVSLYTGIKPDEEI
jgi:hypothetical protein